MGLQSIQGAWFSGEGFDFDNVSFFTRFHDWWLHNTAAIQPYRYGIFVLRV